MQAYTQQATCHVIPIAYHNMRKEPKSSYAIADLVEGREGALLEVSKLTLERGIVIWLGMNLAHHIGQTSAIGQAITTSTLMSVWIAADYWLHLHGYGGMAFYS